MKRLFCTLALALGFAPAAHAATAHLTVTDCASRCSASRAIQSYNQHNYTHPYGDHITTSDCTGSRTRVTCHEYERQVWGSCTQDGSVCVRLVMPLAWRDRAVLRHGHWVVREL